MKSILLKTVFIFIFTSLGFNLIHSFAVAEEEAKVVYVKGTVKVMRADEDFWILAKKAMILNDKDKIKTFVGSEVEIALDSTLKNIVKLQPGTEITLKDLKNKRLDMPKGKVLSLLEALPAGSSFEVHTPAAVAGVMGSGIGVDTDGKKTHVRCFEERAYVKGISIDGAPMAEVVIINQGYKRIIGRFQEPGELAILTALDRNQWSLFREQLKEHLDTLRDKRAEGSREAALTLYEIGKMKHRQEQRQRMRDDLLE